MLLIGLFSFAGVSVYRTVYVVVPDAYAQWWVADMVIEHMERNDGAWPKSWDDLREPYTICAGRSGPSWSFDELRERVEVDFNTDPDQLIAAASDASPPFRVIYLRSGGQHHWEGREPNQMILSYLNERSNRPETFSPASRPHPDEQETRNALVELGARWELDDQTGRIIHVNVNSPVGAPRYSDDSLRYVKELPELRELNLGYSNITDAGLIHLIGLQHLDRIDLYGTQVTDDGLKELVPINSLTKLVLADDNFSDAGLKHLVKMGQLKFLNLNGARITDAGLAELNGLSNLEVLMLYDTQVTDAGVQQLRESLPSCDIQR